MQMLQRPLQFDALLLTVPHNIFELQGCDDMAVANGAVVQRLSMSEFRPFLTFFRPASFACTVLWLGSDQQR